MSVLQKNIRLSLVTAAAMVALLSAGCTTMEKMGESMGFGGNETTLTGAEEAPPVSTKASGKSKIAVADDKSISGTVTISDMTATAAHIHQGVKGKNGPVIIPLTKTSDMAFSVPANAKLTEAQFAAYKAGNLYVNVHSAAYPNGEIRAQLQP